MIKSAVGAACMGLAVLASGNPASAQIGQFDPTLRAAASPQLTEVQFRNGNEFRPAPGHGMRGRGGAPAFRGRGGPGPRFGGDRGYHGGGYGVGAGLAGLAAGAIIGGAIASQTAPAYGYGYDNGYGYAPPPPAPVYANADQGDATGYCMQRYKSYDPSSGTYLGFDGQRHPCP